MINYKRPLKPASFSAAVAPEKKRLREEVRARMRPSFPEGSDKWGGFKSEFVKAQHGKCGYCDAKIIANQTGDVEHYRPKAEVTELGSDPNTWGRELPNSSNVSGRRTTSASPTGYWWLAYAWENYLLACNRCNSGWKGNLFPVVAPRAIPPAPGSKETPLLLNPFGRKKNWKHFYFTDFGQITPRRAGDPYALSTIQTCGLDRESLRDARQEKAQTTYKLIQRLLDSSSSEKQIWDTLRDLFELGRDEVAFAGVTRAIFEKEFRKTWNWLHQSVASERS